MATEINFSDHGTVLVMVGEAQDAESDMRSAVREAKLFITKRDGQWDPYAISKMEGRFRGTFDMCTPIVDQISGEIEQSDFTLKVSPSGGEASEDTAKTLNGLIRNIRNISNADNVFQQASRSNVIGGFDCWEIVQDWIDGDSFDQDLFIRKVPSAVDSVWFDLGSVEQDRSDARWGVKLKSIPKAEYEEKWPGGSNLSVGDDKRNTAFFNQIEAVVVGQLYYRKPVNIELVRMTDGSVYKDDDKFKSVQDELEQAGIFIEKDDDGKEKRRTRKSWRVFSRMFDGGVWLAEEQKTVFDYVPLVPIYGNFDIVENKAIFYGKLEKLYDEQRSLNYAMSRDIEDGALSPAATVWMTEAMTIGHDYSKMNTDRAPVRVYNPEPTAPGLQPTYTGGPVQSSGLQTTIANMQQMIGASANVFMAQQGNAAPQQSGIAGAQQIDQGNIGTIKWFKALEIPVCHTGRIILSALPRVYDGTRQVRILDEDGTSNIVTLNKKVFDEESQKNVVLNDLSIGEHDVTCDFGPAFNSQQKETAQAFLDMAAIDPSTAARNKDIWLKNLSIPGMDLAAERERVFLFNAGEIPETQWTDEERQQVQQAQQDAQNNPPPPDPMMVAAQAEVQKAQAEQMNAENKQVEVQGNQQISMAQIQLDNKKIDLETEKFIRAGDDKFNVEAAKINQGQQKIDLQAQKQQFDNFIESNKQQQAEFNDTFNNMKTLTDAMKVFIGPHLVEAGINQAEEITDQQERQS